MENKEKEFHDPLYVTKCERDSVALALMRAEEVILDRTETSGAQSLKVSLHEDAVPDIIAMIESKSLTTKIEALQHARKLCLNKTILPVFIANNGIIVLVKAMLNEVHTSSKVQSYVISALYAYCLTSPTSNDDYEAFPKNPEAIKRLFQLAGMGASGASSSSGEGKYDDTIDLSVQRYAASILLFLPRDILDVVTWPYCLGELRYILRKSGDQRLQEVAEQFFQ